jgi:hypothetical protein
MKSDVPVMSSNRRHDGDASSDILGYSSSFTVLLLIVFRTMSDQDNSEWATGFKLRQSDLRLWDYVNTDWA